jgi:hypothetical protein
VLGHNPNIHKWLHFEDNVVPPDELNKYYYEVAADYDRAVILSGSIEGRYLYSTWSPEFFWSAGKRRKRANFNYYDETIRLAGYEPTELRTGQVFFDPEALQTYLQFKQALKGKFIVAWVLAGSSIHKGYLHYAEVAQRILKEIPESVVISLGSLMEMSMSFDHPRCINWGFWLKPIQHSFAMAKLSSVVIGPETAVLNAAGCWNVPKICLLTHSSKKNLTETWANDFSLQAMCACSPCHQLHRWPDLWQNACMLEKWALSTHGSLKPACVGEGFPPEVVYDRIMEVYRLWKKGAFRK